MASPALEAEIRVMLATEKKVLRELSIAYSRISKDLTALQRKAGPSAMLERSQLRRVKTAIKGEMAGMWSRVGNEIRAGRIQAAGAAVGLASEAEKLFRAAGLTSTEIATMQRSMTLAAESSVDAAMRRMQGDSYRPLSDKVYHTQVLVNGQLDQVINQAMLKEANASSLSKAVRGFIRPDTAGGVRYASNRLARTEINNAFHASAVKGMQSEPFTKNVLWNLSGSHARPDVCNDYAEEPHVLGGEAGVWSPMEVPERPHPSCLCFVTAITMGDEEFIQSFIKGDFDNWLEGEGFGTEEMLGISPAKAIQEYAWGKGTKAPLVYGEINQGLRAGKTLSGKASKVDEGLEKAFQMVSETNSTMRTYRQFPGDDEDLVRELLSTARGGKLWSDKAYVSTTKELDILEDFDISGTGIRMNIRVPRGSKVLHIDDYVDTSVPGSFAQNEWLLPKGSRFVLQHPRRDGDGWVIDADLLLPGQNKPPIVVATRVDTISKLERSIASEIARGKKGRGPVAEAARVNVLRMRAELRKLKK